MTCFSFQVESTGNSETETDSGGTFSILLWFTPLEPLQVAWNSNPVLPCAFISPYAHPLYSSQSSPPQIYPTSLISDQQKEQHKSQITDNPCKKKTCQAQPPAPPRPPSTSPISPGRSSKSAMTTSWLATTACSKLFRTTTPSSNTMSTRTSRSAPWQRRGVGCWRRARR